MGDGLEGHCAHDWGGVKAWDDVSEGGEGDRIEAEAKAWQRTGRR